MPAHLISLPATPGRAGGNKRAILSLNLGQFDLQKVAEGCGFPKVKCGSKLIIITKNKKQFLCSAIPGSKNVPAVRRPFVYG
jgi:hypothetical protein